MRPDRIFLRLALTLTAAASLAACELLFPPTLQPGVAPAIPVPLDCAPGDPRPECGLAAATVSGTVRGPDGELVANVTVRWDLEGSGGSSTDQGVPGRYRIGVPAGPVTLNWFAIGYLDVSRSLVLAPGEHLTLDITLPRHP